MKSTQGSKRPTLQPNPAASRAWLLLAALMLGVAALTAIAQSRALSAQALFIDDSQYLTNNERVRSPSVEHAMRFMTEVLHPTTVGGYYQPLAMISLQVDTALGGTPDNLRPFHRTSLTLHAANSALVVLLLYLLFGSPWTAAVLGLVFGVHPMTVETFVWVAERKTVLAAFFSLIALIAYVVYAREGRRGFYAACVAAYVLALLSKPTSTPLPLLMLLLDFWPLKRLDRRAVMEKLPLLAIGAISAVVTVVSQGRAGAITLPTEYPPFAVPLIVCHNIVFYLQKLVLPLGLSAFYAPPQPLSLAHPAMLVGLLGTIALAVLLIVSMRWTRALLAGCLFFFVGILPTLGIIGFTMVIASDKYVYLPAIGLLLPLASLVGRWERRRAPAFIGAAVILLAIAGGYAFGARAYAAKWQNTETLYRHVVERAPKAPLIRNNLANLLLDSGQVDEAIRQYELVLESVPEYTFAARNLGRVLVEYKGDLSRGIGYYRQALQHDPGYVNAHVDLANALVQTDQREEALKHYQRAIELDATHAPAYAGLAALLIVEGRPQEAMQLLDAAVQLRPDHADARANRGALLAGQGRAAEARADFEAALRINGELPMAHRGLGELLLREGNPSRAMEHLRKALAARPDDLDVRALLAAALAGSGQIESAIKEARDTARLQPDGVAQRFNLATLLLQAGRRDEAAAEYEQVLRLRSDHPRARNNLGAILADAGRFEDAIVHYRSAIAADPNYIEARYNLATALDATGEAELARAEYEAILKLDPQHAPTRERLATRPASGPAGERPGASQPGE